jgi:UPF0271 protein
MNQSPRTIDLNADLGEGFPNDASLLALVTSASIACGGHAGDRDTALATLERAQERGVVVGAHPSFFDREGFGRRARAASASEVQDLVLAQFAWLKALAAECGVAVRFVKPHGALYNQAQVEDEIARGIVLAMGVLKLPVLGQPGSALETLALDCRIRFIPEGFPDRRYLADGRLVPRSAPDALIHDPEEVARQVEALSQPGIATLCVHGDEPRAVEIAQAIRAALERHGIAAKSFV